MKTFYHESATYGVCGMVNVDDVKQISETYAVIQYDGVISRLIEKPGHIFDTWMGTGNCVFPSHILDYVKDCPVNERRGRREKELVDLIQCAIDDGKTVRSFQIGQKYFNVNSRDVLMRILERKENI